MKALSLRQIRRWPVRSAALALASGSALAALSGCAEMPTGPTVAVMPGPNKPFEVFVNEDRMCRDWALSSSGAPGSDAAAQRVAGTAVAGTVLGAAVGALAGGHSGAAVGGAFGLAAGSAVGSDQNNQTAYSAQRRYDIAYQQCMYAKGNQLPGRSNVYYSNYRSPPAPVPPAPSASPEPASSSLAPPPGIQPPPPVR